MSPTTKTSDEDIAIQHAASVALLKTFTAVAPPSIGEIPLSAKQIPLAALLATNDPTLNQVPCLSTRGCVDVTVLKTLIHRGHGYTDLLPAPPKPITKGKSGGKPKPDLSFLDASLAPKKKIKSVKRVPSPPSIWDIPYATSHNVSVTRPSHDAWGIKSVVLLFCDDFLTTVYEMPWWHDQGSLGGYVGNEGGMTFKEAVEPILKTLGLDGPTGSRRIVRMLLASMPPGVTIPVHHDTGEWVAKSHRVHVPIITTPAEVMFRCGGGEADGKGMSRVQCDEGRVFEMNNQAKHAVSNCSSDYRVHLILDYVDECDVEAIVKRRVKLEAGETVYQTRRSIDRERDRGRRETPSFLILGAQKAGTTSMYEYLMMHPLCVSGKRRETHFFDWRWQQEGGGVKRQRAAFNKYFFYDELQRHPSCMTGDSTPSYLLHSSLVIPRVKAVCPWVKLIVMLRDPVKRAHSHYVMVTSADGTEAQKKTRGDAWWGKTFEEVVDEELAMLEEAGLREEGLSEGEENLRFVEHLDTLPMNTGSHSLLSRGMYELQLRQWMAAFEPSRFLVVKMEDMRRDGIQKAVGEAFEFLDLPAFEIADEGAKNSRSYEGMGDEVRVKLERFYEEYDRKLFAKLGWTGWK